MKISKLSRRRIFVTAVWLVSMIVISLLYSRAEKHTYMDQAKKELAEQAEMIDAQIPSLLYNGMYSSAAIAKMQDAKLNALSMALENIGDVSEIEEFMERFSEKAGISGLTIYDLDGNLVYADAEDPEGPIDFETVLQMSDVDFIAVYDALLSSPAVYSAISMSSAMFDDEEGIVVQKIRNGQWLLGIRKLITEKEEEILRKFDWSVMFQQLKVGKNGLLLAVDSQDGIILSMTDRDDMASRPVEEMDIRIEGKRQAASLDVLQETFSRPYEAVGVRIGEEEYEAVRLQTEYSLVLAMQPLKEMRNAARDKILMRLFVMFLVTGVCTLFAVLQMKDAEQMAVRSFGRFGWNFVLSGSLAAGAVLAVVMIFVMSFFLESLLTYVDTFRYCNEKSGRASEIYRELGEADRMLSDWISEEYLTRCRIAAIVLERMEPEEVTREYLAELSDSLDVECIYVFDRKGTIKATNSPYDRKTIGRSSPFYALLESRQELTGELVPDWDLLTYTMDVGVSTRDREGICSGVVMITGDIKTVYSVKANLSPLTVFEQTGLKDGTYALMTDVETDLIDCMTAVEDGKYLTEINSVSYKDSRISDVGIQKEILYDGYNGLISLLNQTYFTSVRRTEDCFLLIMRPQPILGAGNLKQSFIAVVITLAVCILLILAACLRTGEDAARGETAEPATGECPMPESPDGRNPEERYFLATIGNILNRRKPGFEERWPRDCTAWRNKTADEKFWISLKCLLVITMAAILINAGIAGKGSVWYCLFNGKWRSGMNLYTLLACVIVSCMLFVIKMAVHRLLFLTARATNMQGETVCQLLDSFSGYILVIVGVFSCLSIFGINTRALSLTAGVAGVIFSLGCQNIVADILAGILMTFEGVVHVGDFLFFNGKPEEVMSIGVRTTRLKFFSEVTVVRNNDFKNYVLRPVDKVNLVPITLTIDLKESLKRVEDVLEEELPAIHEKLCAVTDETVTGPKYGGVKSITEDGVTLAFSVFCKGKQINQSQMTVNRELKLLCERRGIAIAMPQVVVNQPKTTEPEES